MNSGMKLVVCSSIAVVLLTVVGCGNDGIAPVSGTISHNGEPLENVFVVFTPNATEDNHFPGLFSTATTDSSGRYSLKTKQGSTGAVIGEHAVGFTWADVSPIEMSMLQEELATSAMAEDPQAARAAVEQKIRELKEKNESRPSLDQSKQRTFKVPSGGSSSADFDLAKD